MHPIPVRLTPDQLAWLDLQVRNVGISRNAAIRLCIMQAMARGILELPTPARQRRTRRAQPAPEARP